MCIVSAIHEYGRQNFNLHDMEKWIKPYQETIKSAKELDKVTGQTDCETEEKTIWMKEIEEKLEKLEKRKKMEGEEVKILDLIDKKRELEQQIFDLKALNETLNNYLREHSNYSDKYQEKTRETAIYPNSKLIDALNYLALGFSGEVGEVNGKLSKIIRDKDGYLAPEDFKDLKKEVGDCLWFLARLTDELGYKLSDVMDENLKKLADRKARGVIGGSGDTR